MKVEDAVIGYAKMKEQQKSLRTQLDRVERLLAEASVALQKLIVSSGVKQVIYDRHVYFVENGLQVEHHDGIVVDKTSESDPVE